VFQDVQHAVRALAKQPGYFAAAAVTLMLGIGFSTATYSVIDGVLLRPLPYDEPDRLVRLIERNLPRFPRFSVSPGHYLFWREQASAFEGLGGWVVQSVTLDAGGEAESVRADRVTANLFDVLGVRPFAGRGFTAEDDEGPEPRVVVLSHAAWQRRFGGDAGIVGQTIRLDRRPMTVVGIMPPDFRFPAPETEMWVPAAFPPAERRTFGSHYMHAVGRLKPGVSLEQAAEDMASVSRRLAVANPPSAGWDVLLFGLHDYMVQDVRPSLYVLLGAVSLVLLIGCANVANLLLARGAGRHVELAIRSSLGATRGRLFRQLLVEQFVLAGAGAAGGVLLAAWLLRVMLALSPEALPGQARVRIDGGVLAFAVALTAVLPALFGLLPAAYASRPDVRALLARGGRQGPSPPAGRARAILVMAEVALAVMLLVGAGLLVRSFRNLVNEPPGFTPAGVAVAGVSVPAAAYPQGAPREQLLRRLLDDTRALPSVAAAAIAMPMPMINDFNSPYEIEGDPQTARDRPVTLFYAVSRQYFEVMRIPVLRGRPIDDRDRANSTRVIVVNETLARRHFPGGDAIGRRIRVGQGPEDWREIVGVAGDVKQSSLDEAPRAQVYESYLQHPYFSSFTIAVRSATADALDPIPAVRTALAGIDPTIPLDRVRTLDRLVEQTTRPQRFSATLIGAFGISALLLAAVGVYGVIAHTVGQRRQEFAIRVAHGARTTDILALVLRGAARVALSGVVAGLGAAWALRGLLGTLLFNVSPGDPATFGAVAALLTATALAAATVPAWRASRVDPATTLRT
jgi:putative ABC transport system permease protein